jgi:hypothetical protein
MNTLAPTTYAAPKFGSEIDESLRSRLEKLEQAVTFASTFITADGQPAINLDALIKKTGGKPECLEMFRELAEEEPTTDIRPQTVVKLLDRKIMELKKALAVLETATHK